MSKKTTYKNAPKDIHFSQLEVVDSHLAGIPSPEAIAKAIELKPQKVTITLDSGSVDFFKRMASEHGVKYQAMIREVLLRYSQIHS
ncbi:CopG family transcriptional regulator [Candidatus Woesebacteria bacterium]|nr:CopG family transcriptional regulator [Candidatus Woesebacteria bacterium]